MRHHSDANTGIKLDLEEITKLESWKAENRSQRCAHERS